MGRHGRELVEREHDQNKLILRTEEIYAKLVGRT